MTVAENIALSQGYKRSRHFIDWRGVRDVARRSLASIAPDIDPDRRVGDLTRTEKSLVAIARALGVDARVLVLDEPTASLPQEEVQVLFRVLRVAKSSGVGMIYVSHRLDEIFAISDRLVVLRDGKLVDMRDTCDADPDRPRPHHHRAPAREALRSSRSDPSLAGTVLPQCRHGRCRPGELRCPQGRDRSPRGAPWCRPGAHWASAHRHGAPCVRRYRPVPGGSPTSPGRARQSPMASPSCRAIGSGSPLPMA